MSGMRTCERCGLRTGVPAPNHACPTGPAAKPSGLDLRYQQVQCADCGRRYQCRPSDDYYNATSATDGICIGCLKDRHQLKGPTITAGRR